MFNAELKAKTQSPDQSRLLLYSVEYVRTPETRGSIARAIICDETALHSSGAY